MQDDLLDLQRKLAADRRHAEEMQLHRWRVGVVRRPIVWKNLIAQIKDMVVRQSGFSATNPDLILNLTVAPDGNSFTMDRPAYPQARVEAVFNNPVIELRCWYQKTDDSDVIEWSDAIQMPLDDHDQVFFQYKGDTISFNDAASKILAPVREPAFKPPKA